MHTITDVFCDNVLHCYNLFHMIMFVSLHYGQIVVA